HGRTQEGGHRAGSQDPRRAGDVRSDGLRQAGRHRARAARLSVAGDPRVQEGLDRALAEVAGARSTSDLEQIRVRVLGRAGQLTTLLRSLGGIPAAERPKVGEQANRAKAAVEAAIAARLLALKADEHRQTLAADRPDLTLPGRRPLPGAV